MRIKGNNDVGRFAIDLEVVNYGDLELAQRGALPADQVRRLTIRGVVDSGATKLVLPHSVVKQLGLRLGNKIKVRYADGRRSFRRGAQGAYVELLGRSGTFTAIVEPKRPDALIGAIVLEDLDLMVDCNNQRLVPRNPEGPLFEIE